MSSWEGEGKAPRAVRALISLTRDLRKFAQLEDGLRRVAETAMEICPAEGASVRLFDERREEFLAVARAGERVHESPLTPLGASLGLIGWVAKNCRSALVNDTEGDGRFVKRPDQRRAVKSIVCAPLLSHGEALGVLGVTHTSPFAFAPEHEDLIQLLANCAAPAIEVARLERLSLTDSLTNLNNRRYLDRRVDEEIRRAVRHNRPLSLAVIDLDNFKPVNDRHGHLFGDRVLRLVADRLLSVLRIHDCVARMGGDEFVVLMPESDVASARVVAGRLNAVFREPISVTYGGDHFTIGVTLSIGVASLVDGDFRDSLIKRADEAMLQAKKAGGNRYVEAAH